jgi:hypothetical protein
VKKLIVVVCDCDVKLRRENRLWFSKSINRSKLALNKNERIKTLVSNQLLKANLIPYILVPVIFMMVKTQCIASPYRKEKVAETECIASLP